MGKVTTPETIGELNKKLILDYIRKFGPVSRADIKRNLGMSFPSVSANVKNLLDANYLIEVGEGDNTLGRKSTLVDYNATRGYVVGADMGRSQMRVMIADLRGNEILSVKEDYTTKQKKSREIIKQLEATICNALQKTKIDAKNVKCISIGIPGVMDRQIGDIVIAPFFESLKQQEIMDELQSCYDVPVLIENSVNYGAIGEKWRGAAQGYKNIVYIDYGVGIGAALIVNGELFTGVSDMAGEIGFMVLERINLRTRFDEQGVLENMISGNQINQALKQSGLYEDMKAILQKHNEGDQTAQLMIKEIVDYIGMLLINISAMVNPELIVLSGRLGSFLGEALIPEWEYMLENHVPCPPKIVASKLAGRTNIFGAVAAGLRYINE